MMRKWLVIILVVTASLHCYAAVIKIGLVGDCHSGVGDVGDLYGTELPTKLGDAMTAFDAAEVDAIVQLGDYVEDLTDLATDIGVVENVLHDDGTYTNLSGVKRLHCIGNHDCAGADAAAGKAAFIAALTEDQGSEENSGYYFSYNIPDSNIHIVILDANYDVNGDSISAQSGYLGTAQLAWLETDLTTADAAGKFSFLFSHHNPPSRIFPTSQYVADDDALYAVITQHRVQAYFHGHVHEITTTSAHTYHGTNSLGNRIMVKGIYTLVNGTGISPYGILKVNNTTGEFQIDGNSLETGMHDFQYTNGAGTENPDTDANWEVYDVADSSWSTLTYTPENGRFFVSDAGDENKSLRQWGDGDYDFMCELHLEAGLTLGTDGIGWRRRGIESVFIAGGFGNTTYTDGFTIVSRYGFGQVTATGVAGVGGDKTVTLEANLSNDRIVGVCDIALGDDTYTIQFTDSLQDRYTIEEMNLHSGKVDVIDVFDTDDESVQVLNQYGGVFNLSRGALDKAVDISTANIHGGTFDMSTGANAANGKAIGVLNIHAPTSQFVVADATITTVNVIISPRRNTLLKKSFQEF